MEEPAFPFYSDGDESQQEHCYDCGKPLPDEGDPAVIHVRVTRDDGTLAVVPACRAHWRDAHRAVRGER